MATLTIRNVDASVKERLRARAAKNGRSMEAELRSLIVHAVEAPTTAPPNLAETIRHRFETFGGVELDLPNRQAEREPPIFE